MASSAPTRLAVLVSVFVVLFSSGAGATRIRLATGSPPPPPSIVYPPPPPPPSIAYPGSPPPPPSIVYPAPPPPETVVYPFPPTASPPMAPQTAAYPPSAPPVPPPEITVYPPSPTTAPPVIPPETTAYPPSTRVTPPGIAYPPSTPPETIAYPPPTPVIPPQTIAYPPSPTLLSPPETVTYPHPAVPPMAYPTVSPPTPYPSFEPPGTVYGSTPPPPPSSSPLPPLPELVYPSPPPPPPSSPLPPLYPSPPPPSSSLVYPTPPPLPLYPSPPLPVTYPITPTTSPTPFFAPTPTPTVVPLSPAPAPPPTALPSVGGATAQLPFQISSSCSSPILPTGTLSENDTNLLNGLLKLEYLLTQFYLSSAFNNVTSFLTADRKALRSSDSSVEDMLAKFAAHQLGHISGLARLLENRAAKRPEMDLSRRAFSAVMNAAFGEELEPAFDPFANSTNLLLASQIVAPLAPAMAVGALAELQDTAARRLVAGMVGTLSSQDTAIRAVLLSRKQQLVAPYDFTVNDFLERIGSLRNLLDLLDGSECTAAATSSAATGTTINSSRMMGQLMLINSAGLVPSRSPSDVLSVLVELGLLRGQ